MLLRKAEMQGVQSILENSSATIHATICNDSCNDSATILTTQNGLKK